MATVQRKLVHKQFNSPIGLYSDNNVKSTLNRELKAFSNGTMGVDCDDNAQPANLANSAVLKYIKEEERKEQEGGVKRVTWPPEHEYQAKSSPPQHQASPSVHYQHQNGSYSQPQNQYQYPSYQTQSEQPSPVTNNCTNQSYHQPASQPIYKRQISERSQYPTNQTFAEPEPTYMKQQTPSYLQSPPPAKPSSCTAAFSGGISVGQKKPSAPDNHWSHVTPAQPVRSGYVQQMQYNQSPSTQYHQSQPYNNDQYRYQSQPQPQQQQTYQTPQQPTQKYQNQQYQSAQPQQYQPVDNFYCQPSPGVITLRTELPITQDRPLIYASEPAANSFGGGGNMRGDNKWPPEEYKKLSEIENEQRRQLALGPAFRPRRADKDYRPFFQRHAINSTYPGYRAPPGTQHYGYQYPQ